MRPHKIVDILAVLLVVGFLTYAGAVFFKPHAVISETAKESFYSSPPVSSGVDDVQSTESAAANLAHLADTAGSESWDVQDSPWTASSESGFYISAPIAQKTDPPAQSLPLLPQIEHPLFDSSGSHGGTSTSPSSPTSTPLTGGPAGSGNGGNDNGKDPASAKEPNKKPQLGNRDELPLTSSSKLFMFVALRTQACFKILEYPQLRPLFAPDFIWHVTGFRNEGQWERMMRLLRQHNKNIIIGYYHSACTTIPAAKDYQQPNKMPNEQVPNNWILKYADGKPVTWPDTKDRYYLDLRKSEARQAMISLAVARTKHYGYDAISFDNCYWGMGVPAVTGHVVSAEQWTEAFLKFYQEAGKAAHENNLKCIVNVAMRANEIPDGFEAIAPYVDGIMTEMPFHETVVKAGLVQRELAAYEKVLKNGTMVFLLQTFEGRGYETLELARPLVDKYDTIYICIEEWWPHYFRQGYNEWGKGGWSMHKVPPVSTWYRNPANDH